MTSHERELLWLVERGACTWDTVAANSREAPTVELADGISALLRKAAKEIRARIEAEAAA